MKWITEGVMMGRFSIGLVLALLGSAGCGGVYYGRYTGTAYSVANWRPEIGDTVSVVLEKMERPPNRNRNGILEWDSMSGEPWVTVWFPPGTKGRFERHVRIVIESGEVFDTGEVEPRATDVRISWSSWREPSLR